MDRKLKERLIGAVVLVALGVWLIPWVLDGPPPEIEPDATAALELPVPVPSGRSEPLRRETVELDASAYEPSEAPPSESPPLVSATETETESPPDDDSGATSRPAERRPEPRNEPAAATAREAPRNEAPAARSSAEGGWMIQLGSFGDEANAERQADRVKTYGHDAGIYEFTAGARTMYRVRIGFFDSRQQAEATVSSLSAHGFPAQIVAPE